MKLTNVTKVLTLALCSWLSAAPAIAAGDDIDIFTGASAGDSTNPRILVILDNSSNWSREDQKWPGMKQGEAELQAIRSVVKDLNSKVSFGLMMYGTGPSPGSAGFVRQNLEPVTPEFKIKFENMLKNVRTNDADEKGPSSSNFGDLMRSAYRYLAGLNALNPSGVIPSMADSNAYVNKPYTFKAPVDADNICGKTYIVLIGNTANGGANADTTENLNELKTLTTDTAKLPLATYSGTPVEVDDVIGPTKSCYATADAAKADLALSSTKAICDTYSEGCRIGSPTVQDPDLCPPDTTLYSVIGTDTVMNYNMESGVATSGGAEFYADRWAKMLAEKGVPVGTTTAKVVTYTVDVHNRKPDEIFTAQMQSMAKHGKGKYFKATTDAALRDALKSIMGEILSVNSAFASTSLPVNATNRTQNENQVFIGMFRPQGNRRPRWMGNLKRYKLVYDGSTLELAGEDRKIAVNKTSGYMTPCARSFWGSDSGNYWSFPAGSTLTAEGGCTETGVNVFSDRPDGELVEKGAVAQILRQGNATGVSTSRVLNRTLKTLGTTTTGTALVDFNSTNVTEVSADVVNHARGADVNEEKSTDKTLTRPSIHGDVIHSRPLPVNYGPAIGTRTAANAGVTIYYGSNDGFLHAVDAATGIERWGFIAPEFIPRLQRLKDNLPYVKFPGESPEEALESTRKDYYFDGSIGLLQNADSSKTRIFPSMRRGGRGIYSLDVSTPSTPVYKWRVGCRNLGDDFDCDEYFSGIGQTWSTPVPAFIQGFSEKTATSAATPVVIFGGGYDGCEDKNAKIGTECDSAKGRKIFIVNADTGAHIKSFDTLRPVASDIAVVDVNSDGYVDYAYAVDTGGNTYRISFVSNPTTTVAKLEAKDWTSRQIGKLTASDGRKVLFAPALLYTAGKVYVAFGTGDREHPLPTHYPYTTDLQNRFYVFKDDLAVVAGDPLNFDTLDNFSTTSDCTTVGATPSSTVKGWYVNLKNGTGEQVVSSALIVGGMVTFNTNRPNPPATGTCKTSLGRAYGYWLNLFNGSGAITADGTCGGAQSSEFVNGGLPPTPVLASSVPITESTTGELAKPFFATVVIGAVQQSGSGANVAFSPQQITPKISRKRKRTYTYTSAD